MLYPSNALSILNIVKHRTKNITCLVCDVKERVRAWHYTDTDTTFQHYAPLHHLPLIIKHKYKHKLVDIQYISNEDQTSRYSWVGTA